MSPPGASSPPAICWSLPCSLAFFPQLLAGPIERAGRMLPQFHQPRKLTPDTVSAGIYLLFSGFFKKLVIADNLGVIANHIFDNYTTYSGIDLLIAWSGLYLSAVC